MSNKKIFKTYEEHEKSCNDCPKLIKEAIKAMAEFQRWIFQGKDPKEEIQRMINGNK